MKELILFGFTFLLMIIVYEFIVYRFIKKLKGKKQYELAEVSYLVNVYRLDINKVNYKKLLHVIAFTSSLDIAIVVTIIANIKSFMLELIIGFISMIIIILISYHIVYLIYKKKGMIKNESKRNRK